MRVTSITIESRPIGPGHAVFVIAEIGINHDGSEETAARMIDAAAAAGADAVKFQTVDAAQSYLPGTASYEAFAGKALSLDAYRRLNAQARALGMVPFSTPGDLSSLKLMIESGMQSVKISSGQSTNKPLLEAVGRSGLPLIVSTGMADIAGIERTVETLEKAGARQYALLHCTALYPAPADTLNLSAIRTMSVHFDCPIGYSDHYLGPTAVLAAVALGATIIEKHFSLDRTLPGADHHISAEPDELTLMIREVRAIEKMIGSGQKTPVAEEARLAPERWRYLVAQTSLPAGHRLTPDDVVAKRVPSGSGGIRAADIDQLLGRILRRALAADTPIRGDDLETAA